MKKLIVLAFTLLLGGPLLFSEKPVQEKPDKDSLTDSQNFHYTGETAQAQTKDLVDLPGKFGKGSSTLARWIKENIEEDKANGKKPLVENQTKKIIPIDRCRKEKFGLKKRSKSMECPRNPKDASKLFKQ